jgi:2-methylisocitrate lyase-like PEP mutase family enzyme
MLGEAGIEIIPGIADALQARLVERAGFRAAFLSGFAVSASRLALPDAGFVAYPEMLEQGREACAAAALPIIGDADTGFGNAVNVRRTVQGYARAGFACVMIEDQVSPKRCGFAEGVEVVPRKDAVQRLKAALDARDEGADILVIGRTDSRKAADLDEALWRCEAFADLGCDIVYFEGPQSEAEMEALCRRLPDVPKMLAQADRRERALTPPKRAEAIGFKLALFGITLLSVQVRAMRDALALMREGGHPGWDRLTGLDELYETLGFDDYYALEKRYAAE